MCISLWQDLAKRNGATAVLGASQNGHLEIVRLLLESGADKDLTKNDGATALTIASQNGHLEVVRLLLESGADGTRPGTLARKLV